MNARASPCVGAVCGMVTLHFNVRPGPRRLGVRQVTCLDRNLHLSWPRGFSTRQSNWSATTEESAVNILITCGAYGHETKEHDLPLVQQGRSRRGALLRRHVSG